MSKKKSKKPKKTCLFCGKVFRAVIPDQDFCSKDCGMNYLQHPELADSKKQ